MVYEQLVTSAQSAQVLVDEALADVLEVVVDVHASQVELELVVALALDDGSHELQSSLFSQPDHVEVGSAFLLVELVDHESHSVEVEVFLAEEEVELQSAHDEVEVGSVFLLELVLHDSQAVEVEEALAGVLLALTTTQTWLEVV